ncbi:metallophosphoesterase [Methanospirillum purgamenti]|jgi:metallophosphoesterase superfamily enzyme|uniref:Metallophosphoesterase n=1 Tax=Methanospirillum hungatei TaxID=2203 RepID=A0A8F5VQF6_METHU|nr:metallophosphoesterase [Methanospirillum hungatei]NLW76022.1 metallophosphoesterase [Methanomicrobiales archaeon]QXO95328.1 metallophosphoesterase [Methanospirillum hungatei]
MNIDFFPDGPAVQIEEESRILFFADIHMGIEHELQKHGFHFRTKGKERITRICNLIKEAEPDLVVILGDVKHRIPGTSFQEFYELQDLFLAIRKISPFCVTPGNHDPGIEEFLKPEEIRNKEGSLIDQVGALHGHMVPDPAIQGRLILCGHHHPIVSLSDQVGVALRTPCFILGELDPHIFSEENNEDEISRILMVPSCNELTGYGIEKTFRSPFSPLSRSLVIESAEILLPDGTYAGDLLSHLQNDTKASS